MISSENVPPNFETNLLSPSVSTRSSKSVLSEVRTTLLSMINPSKESKGDSPIEHDTQLNSHKQRTLEAFTKRLRTFTKPILNWIGKPLCLSPPLLAQYGWQCIGVDTIKCCSCSAVLSINLPWPGAVSYRQQCYSLREKILASHMKICSWPSYPCSDAFVVPFLNGVQDSDKIIEEFITRCKNLSKLSSKLPKINKDIAQELDLKNDDMTMLSSLHDSTESDSPNEEKLAKCDVVSILAMCGWDTNDNESCTSPGIVSSCREIKLHNFFLMEEAVSAETTNDDSLEESASEKQDGPPPKKSKSNQSNPTKIEKKIFHPIKQHHLWCHWVTSLKPISNAEFVDQLEDRYHHIAYPVIKESIPGWKVVKDVLLRRNASIVAVDDPAEVVNEVEQPSKPILRKSVGNVSPEKAVADFRRLMKELSSPK